MRVCRAGSYNQNGGTEELRAELSTTQLADGSLLSRQELTEDAKGNMFGLSEVGTHDSEFSRS